MTALLSIVPCARCTKSCLIRSPYLPAMNYGGLTTLVPATTGRGLCEECAAHWWLASVDGFRWGPIESPELLCLAAVQVELGRIMGLMHPALGNLDWGRLLDQWDLPWPDDWALAKDG